MHLSDPVPGYPRGKRFDYTGPGGTPHSDEITVLGKLATGFRGMQGKFQEHLMTSAGWACWTTNVGNDKSYQVIWQARKLGRKK